MKDIKTFILESKGADIKDRKNSRFFGDDLTKPKNLKHDELLTKKFFKEFRDDINKDIYDFLEKLATNRQGEYDQRSTVFAGFDTYEDYPTYEANFRIHCDSLPSAIENKLSTNSIKGNFKMKDGVVNSPTIFTKDIYYSMSTSGFGNTTSLIINLLTKNKTPNKKLFFDIFNFIGEILNEVGDDILNYHDEDKDREIRRERNK